MATIEQSSTRRPDVDALRVGATYLLLVFHTAKVYDEAPFYHVKAPDPSAGLDVVTAFIHQWHMPLFFLLAGWALAASLQRRTPQQLRAERRRRLLWPLLAGTVLMGPVIRHIELRHIDGVDQDFWSFLPTFFTDPSRFTWSHLWFLAYLFTFTLLYLPLLARWNRREADLHVTAWHLVGAVAGLAVIQVALRHVWPGWQNLVWDWANVTYYSGFFLGGWAIGRFPSVDRLVDRSWRWLGLAGLVAAGLQSPFWLGWASNEVPAGYVAYWALSAVAGAGIVIGILGLGRRTLHRDGRLLRWLADSALPVYILHQLAVVVVAVHIAYQPWPLTVRFTVTLALASTVTVAAYAWIVRPARWLWPLFGIRPAQRATGTSSAPAPSRRPDAGGDPAVPRR